MAGAGSAGCRAWPAVLDAGGDCADGAIAYEGAWLGGEALVSFDEQAATLLSRQGGTAQLADR